MHSTSLAPAGKAVELESREDGEYIRAKVVEPGAIKLTEEGVYSAFSIGISRPRIVRDAEAANGRIIDGVVTEVSLVDYPANPTCKFALTKAATIAREDGVERAEDWRDVGEHELIDDVHKAAIEKSDEPEVDTLDSAAAPAPEAEPIEDPEEPVVDDAPEEPVVVDDAPASEVADAEDTPPAPVDPPVDEALLPAAPAVVELGRVPDLIKRITEATVEKAGAGSAALAAVHALLVEEISQDGGTGSECYEIEWLADLYTSLVCWVENDEWEDVWEELFAELAAKPDSVKTRELLSEIAARKDAPVEKGADLQKMIDEAVAKATAPLNEEIAKLSAEVEELGAQPDPAKAPFRGGTGGTVPVDVQKDGEPPEAGDGGDEAAAQAASHRAYLERMTKHPSPEMAIKAREELEKLEREAVKIGIA